MDDPTTGPAGPRELRSAEERLAAALEALNARDRLLAERQRRLAVLEDAADRLAAADARAENLSAELTTLQLTRRAELAERDARIAQLEAALAAAHRAAAVAAVPDDLTRIKGIGPAIEALLREMGITTFRQVADLSADERRRVGERLGVFAGRIERDQWSLQALALAEEGTLASRR